MQQAQEWVSEFSRLLVPVGEPDATGDTKHIRQLRVDLNWIVGVFEKRWNATSADHDELNTLWKQIWEQMSGALRTAPPLGDTTTLNESFPRRDGPQPYPFCYDRVTYDPEQMVLVTSDREGRVREV